MTYVRKGDVLIVTKLDRLARSVAHLCEITKKLKAKGVALRIMDSNIDTGTPTGKLMIHLLGSIAEFERDLMLERQRDGIAKAKRDGKYKGRAPTARRRGDEVIELAKRGVSSITIADKLGIGVASVYRILAERGMRLQSGWPAAGSRHKSTLLAERLMGDRWEAVELRRIDSPRNMRRFDLLASVPGISLSVVPCVPCKPHF
jgi:DNA invertase Pin-like site-specific DNA recombinase